MGKKRIHLESGKAVMIGRGAGAISCLEGSVWITSKGRSEDVLLAKGMRLDLRGLKRVCAQSFGRSIVDCLDSEGDRPHNGFPWTLARIVFRKSATSSFSF